LWQKGKGIYQEYHTNKNSGTNMKMMKNKAHNKRSEMLIEHIHNRMRDMPVFQRLKKQDPGKMKAASHICGNGYKGKIIKVKGITFCQFCGKELREVKK
jgi:hypothetical protein